MAVQLNLVPDYAEVISPQIGRLDVVVGVCVKSLVGRNKFVELVNDQENGMKLVA